MSHSLSSPQSPALPPLDPDKFECWIFDLDNTLYPADVDLFAQIDVKMKGYIARVLDLPPEDAFRIQKDYYHRYGTSLRGLMMEHNVEPEDFLAHVHDIDHSVLSPSPTLDTLLSSVSAKKIIYTNGSKRHAEQVLETLQLSHHFDAIQDITAGAYIPKPQIPSYDALIRDTGVDPTRAIFFEDTQKNLAPAHAMGMTTVWVRNAVHWASFEEQGATPPYCDHVTDNLEDWLGTVLER